MLNHPRNKSDRQLKFIIDNEGFIGITTYTCFLPKGEETPIEDCVEVFEYIIKLVGEDNVGIRD